MMEIMENQEQKTNKDSLPLERVFDNPAAKVLDFLLLNQKFDYSESDISNLANVPPRTLQRVLPSLLNEKLVARTRKSSKAFMYQANLESKRTLALLEYIKATMEENLDRLELVQKTDN